MPSIRARTPYPAAAQLFFRLVVTIHESSRAMKWALVLCDLLTIWVAGRVAARDRAIAEWLALVYAWNPLVILEVAHSGHIDALGALWIAVSAWMLSTGRGMRAAIAFVIAVATKLLPIVLVPLYWKRIRLRDAAVAALVLAALYFPFRSAGLMPLGAVPNVVQYIRFNGPLFKWMALQFTPQAAARSSRCSSGWPSPRGCGCAPGRRPGSVGVADGGLGGGGPGDLSVVPALLHAVPVHARDAAARGVDLLRAAGLRGVAPLAARASVVRADARPVAGVRRRRRRDRLRGDSPPAAGRERRGTAYFFSSPAIDATFCFSRASAML